MSFERQSFALRTTGADEDRRCFAGLFLEMCHQPQPIRAARQAPHFEFAKWAFTGRLRWLIIFPALEPAGGIHSGSLCRGWDNGGPSRKEKRDWIGIVLGGRLVSDENVHTANGGSWLIRAIGIINGSAPRAGAGRPARGRANSGGAPNRRIDTTGAARTKWSGSGCGAKPTLFIGGVTDDAAHGDARPTVKRIALQDFIAAARTLLPS